ncbi:MAG TPA: exo-beta-N-acetylmuramidase NamZ domain-containing protein [Candidatus Acidoferrales bacterium]|nr:exo-beta-N-acetylmuramidase NamZ domain-containing protein [Candidatus Acidoferrales bacterium]
MADNFTEHCAFRRVAAALLGALAGALLWAGGVTAAATGGTATRADSTRRAPQHSAAPGAAADAKPAAAEPHLDFSDADAAIEKAVAADELPGAVLLVGHRGHVIYRRAYGSRALLPQREPMTLDTIFDLASLTKVFATTPSVLRLMEQGKIRIADPVARYLPEFASKGKDQITIRQLMTHTGGLPPIPKTPDDASTPQVLQWIYDADPIAPPGMIFVYSDCDFILLGEIVRRLSGEPLNEFAEKSFFAPLGMRETRFLPPASWRPHIAPTEEIDLPEGAKAGSGRGRVLRGVVHDPRARGMGGVAGHAGLFGTADDLARFCILLLAGGVAPDGTRLLTRESIALATQPENPPWVPSLRGLGWDIDSAFSANRGDIFPVGASYGHTGFTGTSVWLDPGADTFVILLANSVHPHGRPALSSLRSRVATAVAAAIEKSEAATIVAAVQAATAMSSDSGSVPSSTSSNISASSLWRGLSAARLQFRVGHTMTGLDVLEQEQFAPLAGKRIGLITNHTGVARDGRTSVDLLAHAPNLRLAALFSPEHGFGGTADEPVGSAQDAATGLPIFSLYGDTRRPTDDMLRGLDALVFDIQDAGVRYYTYMTTMAYCMEEAAKHHLAFYVLDRPNPIGGLAVEGPVLDLDRLNFVGYFRMPIRHGMTAGELAQMFNAENHIGAELHVIAMQDWRRSDFYESTGLTWIPPSPNLRSLEAAIVYPGVELLQAAGVSVGRGTDRPFELVGAPWVHGTELAEYLNGRHIPAVHFVPTRFTPQSGLYKNQACEGVLLVVYDRGSVFPILLGFEMAEALLKFYPKNFDVKGMIALVGSAATMERIQKADSPASIVLGWDDEIAAFRALREKYLLYK